MNRIYGNQDVTINTDDVKNFWEQQAEKTTDLNSVLLGSQKNNNAQVLRNNMELNLVIKLLKEKKHLNILDVGCGLGRWASNLSPYIENYIGVDGSQKYIELAKEKFKDNNNIQFYNIDLAKLDEIPHLPSYDLVIITGVLMYINENVIQELLIKTNNVNAKAMYIQESVSTLDERLVLKDFYSEELQTSYNAIYRTSAEYEQLMQKTLDVHIVTSALMLTKETGAREETNAQYWYLEQ